MPDPVRETRELARGRRRGAHASVQFSWDDYERRHSTRGETEQMDHGSGEPGSGGMA